MTRLTPEQRAYFLERGFTITGEGSLRRWRNDGMSIHHAVTAVPIAPRDPNGAWYWTAIATSTREDTAMELVVSASEEVADPIVAFVTAEVRGWRRQ